MNTDRFLSNREAGNACSMGLISDVAVSPTFLVKGFLTVNLSSLSGQDKKQLYSL